MSGVSQELATDQRKLWDKQHALREGQGPEGSDLVDAPNESAVMLGRLLSPNSIITEVGSANGRDARYWALQGHRVHCLDFSRVALDQLIGHADRQGVTDKVNPIQFDANDGKLPAETGSFDGFYARSALHVDDDTLMELLSDVDTRLRPNGVVLIEGKGTDDPKIARSHNLGNGLAVDPVENGHVRRIWTPDSLKRLCSAFGWTAIEMGNNEEQWLGTDASFLRLVATK